MLPSVLAEMERERGGTIIKEVLLSKEELPTLRE